MHATEVLMEEHQVIMRVLAALDKACSRLEDGVGITAGFFIEAADFNKGFADGCHHKKEEGVLFPAMVEAGLPKDSGPVAVMLAEHEQGRQLTQGMRKAAEGFSQGEAGAKEDILLNARGYVSLLRQHIQKENFILFPMADKIIPPDKQLQLNEGIERIEREETGQGVHEKYLALAGRLEIEAGA